MSKIEGHNNLTRDDTNSAIINNDRQGFLEARRAKQLRETQKNEINTLKEEINDMKELILQINEKMKWQEQ
tara:strand:+ start:466 stop:678 length:213 start_codon:yes stop_codon:yes gene_type:complete